MRIRAVSFAGLVVLLGGFGAASAQSSSQAQAQALALFRQASAARDRGDWAAACPKFEAAMELFRSPATQLNIARCYAHDGKVASAWAAYQRVQVLNRDSPAGTRRDALDKAADEELAAVEPRLPRLRVTFAGPTPPGVTVKQDGREVPVAAFGVALPVDPGKHEIVASAPGHEPWKQTVELKEARSVDVVVDLRPEAPPPGPPAPQPPAQVAPSHDTQRILGFVTLGLGAAGAVVWAVSGAVALAKHGVLSGECHATWCPTGATADLGTYDRARTAATAGFVAAVAGAGGGTALLLTAPRSKIAAPLSVSIGPGRVTLTARFW